MSLENWFIATSIDFIEFITAMYFGYEQDDDFTGENDWWIHKSDSKHGYRTIISKISCCDMF